MNKITNLYRKVNIKTYNVCHNFGEDFSSSRNRKRKTLAQTKGKMSGRKKRGLDYTPLFKFLWSTIGSKWDEVFSGVKSRLDKTEPVFRMVALTTDYAKKSYICRYKNK